MPIRILVVEDEQKIAQALKQSLEAVGYHVTLAQTGEEGFFLVTAEVFDVMLLDLMLPQRNGLEVLTALRKHNRHTPVLILTARDAIEDRVQGLDAGADDYMVKPFAFPELHARLRALLRRGQSEMDDKRPLHLADLGLDLAARRATRGDQLLDLTAREFDLLAYLLSHKGHVVSRTMLSRDLWNDSNRVTPLDNVIDVHIARLRRKLDDPFTEKLLKTVRGVGFILREGND